MRDLSQTPDDPDATARANAEGTHPREERDKRLHRGDLVHRYVVLERLGAGGMGVVYAAYDPELDRRVALKLLRPARRSARAQERLLAEARAMAKLSHPNVIAVHDVGAYEGRVFVAMEFVDGWTLGAWLREGDRDWREVLTVFTSAGHGLTAAHAVGLVHRDFKPDNVMIGRDGRVRVMDFGIARAMQDSVSESIADELPLSGEHRRDSSSGGDLTKTGALVGTPAYMAPEQHLGLETDARTDEFSFAVALYEALHGERPFVGESHAALAMAVVEGRRNQPPRDTRVPGYVDKALGRALAVRPEERFSSVDALLVALGADPGLRRRKWLARVGVVGLLGGAVGLGVWADRSEPSICKDGQEKLAGIWDEERRRAVEAAFEATKLPYAPHTWGRVESALEAHLEEWRVQYVDACQATHVRHEQSEELLDRRMACLDGHLREVEALIGAFEEADSAVVERAVRATTKLGELAECADTKRLLVDAALPDDPATAQRVVLARQQLRQASALSAAGRGAEARKRADAVLAEAQGLEYAPLEAEARYWVGRIMADGGTYGEAETMLGDAFFLAQASAHDRVGIDVAVKLAQVTGFDLARPDDGEKWARQAAALIERIGADALVRARLANASGSIAYRRGEYQAAVDHWSAGLELLRQLRTPDHPEVATALSNVGAALERLHQPEDALEHAREALRIRQTALGLEHPAVGASLDNIGIIFGQKREYEMAADYHRRALAVREAALGPDHPSVATTLNNLGVVLREQDRYEEALAQFERAMEIWTKPSGAHPDLGAPLLNIGNVLYGLGRHEEALDYFGRAMALLEPNLGSDHPSVAVVLGNTGNALVALGRHDEAAAALERGLQIEEARDPVAPGRVADLRFGLARALWEGRIDAKRGAELARDAYGGLEKLGAGEDSDVELESVAVWLAERGLEPRRR